ncbi:hypothetical protein VZ95_01340 [Elstera litoralis]|uniref:Solute-binding protein family 3/N-terminal domain-containing protein n=1 Tax=Elstera litoralis TaxID=552518 RepID=A0A0F3IWG7_9PROT|nr:hypothetical protein [Elstera litoralis]KJV10977.1 hypothetical protein VZ95_01340 [Elstera litoralis]
MLVLSLNPASADTPPQKFLVMESYPWAFYENDRVKGASVEWLAALAATHKLALTPVVTSFQRGLDLVKRGDIDFMIVPDSPRFRDLGTPVFQVLSVPMVLVARPGLLVTPPEKLMNLKSLGIISGLELSEIEMSPVVLPPTEDVQADSALRRMAVGRLDGLIVSKFGLMAEAARQALPMNNWPQRPFGTLQLALFLGPHTPENPQTDAVVRAVRQARDTRSYLPYLARYLSPGP